MKKSTKFIIALLVTVGALAITYRVVNQAPSKDLAADAPVSYTHLTLPTIYSV